MLVASKKDNGKRYPHDCDGMGWEMSRAAAIQAEIEREIASIRQSNPISAIAK